MNRMGRGFTVVEIVVVVAAIAIIATIAIVGYRGIDNRAHDAVITTDLEKVAKALESDKLRTGRYPIGDSTFGASMRGFKMSGQDSYAGSESTISNFTICFHLDGQEIAVTSLSKSGKAFFVYSKDRFVVKEMTLADWGANDQTASQRCRAINNQLSLIRPSTGTYSNFNGYNSQDTVTGPWRDWTRAG